MLKKIVFSSALTLISVTCNAMEPLQDRARLHSMNAELLLPDSTYLNVDMYFDCDSDYANTAMIVTSESGAKLLATAYTALYGEKYGEQVMNTWNNKAKETDPRKPTFIIVTMPQEVRLKRKDNVKSRSSVNVDYKDPPMAMPRMLASCGTLDHDPNGGNP